MKINIATGHVEVKPGKFGDGHSAVIVTLRHESAVANIGPEVRSVCLTPLQAVRIATALLLWVANLHEDERVESKMPDLFRKIT